MSKSNPVALITGGAKRIGAAIANKLHAENFNVIIHYGTSAQEAKELVDKFNNIRENSAHSFSADLNDIDQIYALANFALTPWGKIDVLVNNASRFYPTPIGEITEENWNDLMGSNLKAPLFLSQALAPSLKQKKGCIINIVDIYAQKPLKQHSAYCAAKAGNAMLVKSLAQELGPEVRVNGISPGAILWPEDNSLSEDQKQKILSGTALQRLGSPEDIAETLYFLITAGAYISGQTIAVDGGKNAH